MKTETNSQRPPLNTCTPIPSLLICVKSFANIDLLPLTCDNPSIYIPVVSVLIEVQFCIYGEAVAIEPVGSNDITLPPTIPVKVNCLMFTESFTKNISA